MDSPQSVVSTFNGSSVFEKQNNLEDFIGVLDVYIYQARDIHNICIYHKQDVYAKLLLTSDPGSALSTQIINGGGQSPVFNENLRLKVRTIECSVKCEIWMMSRVRNYLEDQLLGFALVPLTEVFAKNGKLEKEFSLSSTDLFHSPAGFVQLSLSYNGTSPEVIEIPLSPESVDTRAAGSHHPLDFGRIEFPDPKIVNENHLMVSEYLSLQSNNLDSQSSESLVSSKLEVCIEDSFPSEITNLNSPPSSVSNTESPSVLNPSSSLSSHPSGESKTPIQEYASASKECTTGSCIATFCEEGSTGSPSSKNYTLQNGKPVNHGDVESNSSTIKTGSAFSKQVITVDIEKEQKVMQQEIVEMYMKSMQQFTESLAKMKLPLDIENGPTSSGSSNSDQKLEMPKSTGPRVFYGSRAFF